LKNRPAENPVRLPMIRVLVTSTPIRLENTPKGKKEIVAVMSESLNSS
jgi:hypothetical protein